MTIKRPPRFIPGEVAGDKFVVRNDAGETCLPEHAIVPVLKQERTTSDVTGKFAVVGTGFFISQGILITAEHVLADVLDSDGMPTCAIGIFQLIEENSYLPRHIVRSTHLANTDVAVAICAAARHNVTGEAPINHVVRITSTPPALGSEVFTFAYPRSMWTNASPQEINLRQGFFGGRLVESFPSGRDSVMLPGPCFRTSMPIHGGASGGPVFDSLGRVFAINSTGYDDDDVSFVSSISSILNLRIPSVQLPGGSPPQDRTISELATLGYVVFEP